MRDHLDGAAQVIPAAFFQAYLHVYLAAGNVVVSGQVNAQIPLVMPKIQIAFATATSGVSLCPICRCPESTQTVRYETLVLAARLVLRIARKHC